MIEGVPPTFAELRGRVAVVTGGSRGIGRGIAAELGRAGACVVIASRTTPDDGGALDHELLDVADGRQTAAAFERIAARYGGIDVLVNCAGLYARSPLADGDSWAWEEVLRTNLLGAASCTSAASVHLERARGSIVNISSGYAVGGVPENAAYSASKAALESLTRAAAVELGPRGIRVNAVSPGLVVTEMTTDAFDTTAYASENPLGRVGLPVDIASAVRFLASDAASWITGQVLAVDGGAGVVHPGAVSWLREHQAVGRP